MPDVQVGLLLKARDEATAVLGRLTGGVTNLQGALGSLFKGAGAFGLIAAGATSAAGAAIAAASGIANAVEELDRTAFATGVSMEKLQAIQEVVRQGGGEFNTVTSSMGRLNKALAEGEPLTKRLGLATDDTYAAYLKLSRVLTSLPDLKTRNAVAIKLLGKSYQEVLPDMKAIVEGADAMEERLRTTGGLLSGESADSARRADAAFDQLGQTWRTLGIQLTNAIVPAVTAFLNGVNGMLEAINGWVLAIKAGTVGVLGDLATAAADSETYAERIEKAKERVRKEYGGKGNVQVGVPTIAGVEVSAPRAKGLLDDDKPDKESTREKRLKSIMDLMQKGRREAEFYLVKLEALERSKAQADLREKLVAANAIGGPGAVLPGSPRGGGRLVVDDPERARAEEKIAEDAVHRLIAPMMTVPNIIKDVGNKWRDMTKEMLSASEVVEAGYNGLWNGLQNGIGQVFSNLLTKGQTFKSAFVTVFRSLAQEVLSILAKIAAAKVFTFVVGLLTGGASTAVTSGVGTVAGAFGATTPSGGGTSVVVNISAMDKSGVAQSLMDPRGELRYAIRQATLAGAQ